jgi:hypothetical protein
MMKQLQSRLGHSWRSLLTPAATGVAIVISFGAGSLVALVLHFLLFRLTLPTTPFIYVAF